MKEQLTLLLGAVNAGLAFMNASICAIDVREQAIAIGTVISFVAAVACFCAAIDLAVIYIELRRAK